MAKNRNRNRQTTGNGNFAMWEAMNDLRRSSAAQRHTPKSYKGARSTNKRNAIKDYA